MSTDVITTSSNAMAVNMQSASVREYFRSGNVAQLNEHEKDFVLAKLCERYGLDPILRPFDLISFQGGQKFYMTASATNQLANAKGLSREVVSLDIVEDKMMAKCTVKVSDPTGRTEVANGFIAISKFLAPTKADPVPKRVLLDGDDLANALLKLETKTKRRATLSFFGVMDAGSDYEDRPAANVVAPDVSRPQVIADAGKAVETVKIAQNENPVKEEASAEHVEVEKPRRGRPSKKQADVQGALPSIAEVQNEIPAISDAEFEDAIPQVEPEKPKVVYIKYARTQHARQLVDTATKIFGDAGWATDEAKKSAVKAAIPELDGIADLFVEGSTDVLPSFQKQLTNLLIKAGVLKAG